jgi:hypothetical protein
VEWKMKEISSERLTLRADQIGEKMRRVQNEASALLALMMIILMMGSLAGCGKSKADLQTAMDTLSGLSKARGNPLTEEGAWPSSSSALASYPVAKPTILPSPGVPRPAPEVTPEPGGPESPVPVPSASPSPRAPEVGNAIQILGNICTVARTELEPAKPIPSAFEVRISGDACPIEYFFAADARSSGDSSHVHYKARNQRARELLDIDQLDMKMDFLLTDEPKVMEIKLLLTGNSQRNGAIELSLDGPVRQQNEKNISGEVTGTLVIGEQYAEIRQVIELVNEEERNVIYLNEQRLTDEQMEQITAIFPHIEKKTPVGRARH